jgi:hypothetical protein
MTKRVVSLEIHAGETNCADPDKDWACPFLRRAVGDMMAVCVLFPTSTTTSYTHLKIVDGWILRCELCRKAEKDENPVVFINATGICPFCGARFITSYPPQEVPPAEVRCHSCETRMGPREIRRAVENYRTTKDGCGDET